MTEADAMGAAPAPGEPRTAGLLLPTRERAAAGDWDAGPLLDLARRAEALGFDSLWAGDSLIARPRLEPITLLAAVAACTEQVAVGTAALIAAARPELATAAALATLDRVAGGRLVVGVGAGFPSPETRREFAALGAAFSDRLARLDVIVEGWRRGWLGDSVGSSVRPVTPEGPPVWMAGAGPAARRLAARRCDGWLPYVPTAAEYGRLSAELDDACCAAGRDPATVTRGLYVTIVADGAEAEAERWAHAYYGVALGALGTVQAVVSGSVDRCAEALAAYGAGGARHLVMRVAGGPHPDLVAAAAEIAARWRAS